ncbi:SCP-like protein [Oesophagostomum dentatum]|uniref:Glycine N-acyltransferase-like protein n=1 Tax=Oesophagostomum dentatum TaxID=61180 RepID=A0A0B1SYA8_OESDE|nr:SCP-like protein [Oesophagostomum dentatum]
MTESQMDSVKDVELASRLPEGYELGSSDPVNDAELITSCWRHAKEGDTEETRTKLKNLPSSCIRYNGKPVAFEMLSQSGQLNHLFVLEEHRGKALGQIVELDLCQKCRRNDVFIAYEGEFDADQYGVAVVNFAKETNIFRSPVMFVTEELLIGELPKTVSAAMVSLFATLLACSAALALLKNVAGMSSETRQVFITTHNALRSKLAGGYVHNGLTGRPMEKATAMLKLTYHPDLETKAQKRANKCVKSGSSPRTENHGISTNTGISETDAAKEVMNRWWSEITAKGISQGSNQFYSNLGISHFAKVAFDINTHVGCGIAKCSGFYNVVCHYRLVTNEGQQLYKMGYPLKGCPTGTFYYSELCAYS